MVVLFAAGCGSDGASDPLNGSGGAGGTAGSSAGGGGGTGGGTGGTATGGTGSGGTGTGGTAAGGTGGGGTGGSGNAGLDCSGTFGTPELLLSVDPPMDLGGPSITEDELELFYSLDTGTGLASFVVTKRESVSAAFPAASPVPGVSGCSTPFGTMDVSDDGLRLYYACWADSSAPVSVEFADRPDRASAFTPKGTVAMLGGSPAIDSLELVLYSSGLSGGAPLMAERESPLDEFGEATEIPGLATSTLVTPDASPDGLQLFGAQTGILGFVSRPNVDAPFGAFTPVPGLPDNSGAPAISADCRSLYFAARTPSGARAIYVAKR